MIQHHDDPINGSQQGWHGVAAVAVVVEVVIVALATMRMIMNILVGTEYKRW